MREQLTRIYQRHCSKEGESVEDGIKRFGACARSFLPLRGSSDVLRQSQSRRWRGTTS